MQRVLEASKPCANCGTPLSRRRYGGQLEDLTAFRRRRFCSLSCANTRVTLTKHGYSWRARKHLKSSCEACGETRQLQAHHVDQNKANNAAENIQTLCRWCHDFLHTTAKRRGVRIAGRMASLELRTESPTALTVCAPLATRSSRKSRKPSGGPS